VLATFHRPGLLGEKIQRDFDPERFDTTGCIETVEYDIEGPHAAFTYVRQIDQSMLLYAGRYIDARYRQRLAELLDADVSVYVDVDTPLVYAGMEKGTLYETGGEFQAVLAGTAASDFFLVATFETGAEKPIFLSLLSVTGVVALFSVIAAVALGMFITGRAKREIDNLVQASSRVAAGDFTTPVMAYEEGEFSQLADSFSDMMVKLKGLQKELATAEKIAAWQAMGRKVAHEIKNPLTPIAISVDDLRRSYRERLPQFSNTLEETTATIKSEVNRMTKLLDQFVSFARMSAPVIRAVEADTFLREVTALYRREIDSGGLTVVNTCRRNKFRLDPEAFKQVLINLIKNGLEAADDAVVTLTMSDEEDALNLRVEDSGPGFTEEKLQNSFEPYVSTKKGGSGLGLVICHRIVHDHGGTMELYNRREGGGGVRIRLPV
jgi:nitrogen fixation/metabolism regulation signal transduction histidine kinase